MRYQFDAHVMIDNDLVYINATQLSTGKVTMNFNNIKENKSERQCFDTATDFRRWLDRLAYSKIVSVSCVMKHH